MSRKSIFVTQPSLAPLEEVESLLKDVWDSGVLTHNGPMVQNLEQQLKTTLGLRNITMVSNGTIALQAAIRALELKGEIITTAFTWVATVSAIKWEGCTPVFCDIDEQTFNIDPSKIEELITEKTVAIMPVHVFGNPCDIQRIDSIAKKYGLKVIYDAAHAIGSIFEGQSVLNFGDVSATSTHATKLFNTAEGGACVTHDNNLDKKIKRIRFFGHDDQKEIVEDGFNGKMSEIHAALGLSNLKYIHSVLNDRKAKYLQYKDALNNLADISFQNCSFGESNYSYFPIVLSSEKLLLRVLHALNEEEIYPRRYFYPPVNTFQHIVNYRSCPLAESIASRILCLPLYFNLEISIIEKIADIIRREIS